MADLDDELLALVGGDDDEDAAAAASDSGAKDKKSRSASPPPPPPTAATEQPQEEANDDMGRKGVARPVPRRKRSSKKKDDEAEEGEISASSPASRRSLDSAPMSESEPEEDSQDGETGGPGFPYEKLFYSERDKQEILDLPEIKREEILSERAQQVDSRNVDIALRRLATMREREGAAAADKKKKKRKASAEVEESQRKSSRQKTTRGGRKVGEPSDAIEAYKRQREQRGKRDEQRRREVAKKKDERSSSPDRASSDRDRRGSSEVEWDDGKRRGSPSRSKDKDEPPAEITDFQHAKIGRVGFGEVCFYPGFEDAITGCYARVNVGFNKDAGQDDYRMCLVKKFTEGKPYALEGPNGRSFITTQYALLAQGGAEKEFPFFACSESRFTEKEFNRYCQTLKVEELNLPAKSTLLKKNADIHRLINHQFTKEELEEKLRRQGTNDNKKLVYERIQLDRRRQQAVASGDEADIAECDAEIAKLAGPKLAFGTTLVKPRSTEKTQQDRLEEINRRNQKLNTESIRKAQIAERKKERVTAAAVARGEALPDRFARVKTRARTHYDVTGDRLVPVKRPEEEGSDASRAVTPQAGGTAGTNTPNKESTPAPAPAPATNNPGVPAATTVNKTTVNKEEPKGIPVIRHRPTEDDVLRELDFDLDVDPLA